MEPSAERIVCVPTSSTRPDQLLEWADLQVQATAVDEIPDGVRMRLPAGLVDQATDLVERESSCCAFLTITVSDSDALPVILTLSGLQANST